MALLEQRVRYVSLCPFYTDVLSKNPRQLHAQAILIFHVVGLLVFTVRGRLRLRWQISTSTYGLGRDSITIGLAWGLGRNRWDWRQTYAEDYGSWDDVV